MRLYRMELYKICSRKIFMAGVLAIVGLLLAYFWFVEVGEATSAVGENVYSGYEAVQINRRITEKFAGVVTDEKVDAIIEEYGLPSKLEEDIPGWRDGNYLNDFVTRYFTDGDWKRGMIPTKRFIFEQTEFAQAYDEAGMTPRLVYTAGRKVFGEMLQFGLVLGSIFIICVISVIFAEESQLKMLPLIFTSEEGRRKDVRAKVLASFTITVLTFAGIVLLDLGLCRAVYGLDGFHNLSGMVLLENVTNPVYRIPFAEYFCILLAFGFQAELSLCSITLYVSASQNSSFGAVVIAAVCWGLPVLIRIFFGGFLELLVESSPVFLIMTGTLVDVYLIWYILIAVSMCISIGCLVSGTRFYKNRQVSFS